MEPEILRRGKLFHKRVQADWLREAEGRVAAEQTIFMSMLSTSARHVRQGRLDLFVDLTDDYVTVVEIKSTDWDHIHAGHVRHLLGSHRRQVWRYIEKYLDSDRVSVCAGLIYPREPASAALRDYIEQYLNEYWLQVVWYDSPPPNQRASSEKADDPSKRQEKWTADYRRRME